MCICWLYNLRNVFTMLGMSNFKKAAAQATFRCMQLVCMLCSAAIQMQATVDGESKASTFSFFATLLAASSKLVLSLHCVRTPPPDARYVDYVLAAQIHAGTHSCTAYNSDEIQCRDGLRHPRMWCSICNMEKRFLYSSNCPNRLCVQPSFLHVAYGGLSPRE
jgi:hypothetical protein